MSQYSDDDLAAMSKPGLDRLRAVGLRVGSQGLVGRIDRELTRRWGRSGKRQGQAGEYFRRRGDWFVERWDGQRIPVLHSLRLSVDHVYTDDTAHLLRPRATKKDRDFLNMLEVAEIVVVQNDRGDGTDAHWHADGYIGLFRILDRRINPDGAFELKLKLEEPHIRPKIRTSSGS